MAIWVLPDPTATRLRVVRLQSNVVHGCQSRPNVVGDCDRHSLQSFGSLRFTRHDWQVIDSMTTIVLGLVLVSNRGAQR